MNKQSKNRPGGRRRGCLRWGLLVVGGMIGVLLLLFLAAFTLEKIALARLPDRFPAPGEMVAVNDHSLHLHCAGDPNARPVVVVSPGSGSNVAQWQLVQPEVAKFARICIYDRLGSGWSFGAPRGLTYTSESEEVHTLLQNAGIPGPYLLVGHSLGGAVMQVYASMYPQDVLGMVMVDTRTRDIESKYPPEYVQSLERVDQASVVFAFPGVFRLLNWFGLFKTVPSFDYLPPDLREVAYQIDYNSRFFAYQKALSSNDDEREASFVSAGPLPDVPLIVIAHGKIDLSPGVVSADDITLQADRIWLAEMAKLAEETSQGSYIVAEDSGHNIIMEQPGIVIETIRTLVAQMRAE